MKLISFSFFFEKLDLLLYRTCIIYKHKIYYFDIQFLEGKYGHKKITIL